MSGLRLVEVAASGVSIQTSEEEIKEQREERKRMYDDKGHRGDSSQGMTAG